MKTVESFQDKRFQFVQSLNCWAISEPLSFMQAEQLLTQLRGE